MNKLPHESFATYLDELRVRAGLSVRALALEAGYKNGSSVQRYLEDHSIEEIRPDVAKRFAKVLFGKGEPPIMETDLARLIGLDQEAAERMGALNLAKALEVDLNTSSQYKEAISAGAPGSLPIVGNAYASSWMEIAPSIDIPSGWLTMPYVSFHRAPGLYALRILGTSLGRVAPEGHYAVCQAYEGDLSSAPEAKHVHIERRRGGLVEWTIKVVKWGHSGLSLWSDTNDYRFIANLEVWNTTDEIKILGTVVSWHGVA